MNIQTKAIDTNYDLKRVQGFFNKITIHEGKYCFISDRPNDLIENDEIEISIINKDTDYRHCHFIANPLKSTPENSFVIQENLLLNGSSDNQKIIDGFEDQKFFGRWSVLNKYELSIMRCSSVISNLLWNKPFKDFFAQGYYDILYSIMERRIFDTGRIPVHCDIPYLLQRKLINIEEAKDFDIFNIQALNKLVSGYNKSYVNYDNRIVQFDDHFILTPDKYEFPYYTFLILQLKCVPISEMRKVLNYQALKHIDLQEFKDNIKDHFRDLPEELENTDRKEVIWEWVKSQDKPKEITKKITVKSENNFSMKEIAIAYRLMDIKINEMNALAVLVEHSINRSATKLINTIILPSQLSILSGNKTTDSKHLASLLGAERLLLSKKEMKSQSSIRLIIKAFEGNFSNKYLE